MSAPKFSEVQVVKADLPSGKSDIMSVVTQKMWVAGVPAGDIQQFCEELDAEEDPLKVTASWVVLV